MTYPSFEWPEGFLDQLNTTLGTTYSLDHPSLSSFLEACITSRYDFGLIYGLLHVIWYTDNWSTVRDELSREEEDDREIRQEAFFGNWIVDPSFRPRRVWDLYSNRVVPSWSMDFYFNCSWLQPISHTWMDEKDHTVVWMPINRYKWPIPIPKDADLNLIRIEMLNLGAEYAWLDVLCLRQTHLDATGDWQREGDCQGHTGWTTACGVQLESTHQMTRFHKQLWQSTHEMSIDVREALEEMQTRVSTNPVDKIAGLAFLMGSATIPAYYESESLEHAWTALVMTKPLPAFLDHCFDIHWDEKEDEDSCDAHCIEGLVLGLAVAEEGDRRGLLIVKGEGRIEHRFEITATHMSPIPEDTYAMIYACKLESSWDYGWVVGRSLPGGKFEKVSMLIISSGEHRRLHNLGIIKKRPYILI
ncbi:hypothetical protein EDD85DRAFT_1000428 [Armillaria nabsnona]|nr:hypothetical protein EDD85DRAFT_1000428 [Armillaria nabsnona]